MDSAVVTEKMKIKFNSWRYLGYSKEILKPYENEVSTDNLIFVVCAYTFFAVMGYINKPTIIFVYDIINSLPFLLAGLFLSWMKSRSEWGLLINADAMVELKTQKLEKQPHFFDNVPKNTSAPRINRLASSINAIT